MFQTTNQIYIYIYIYVYIVIYIYIYIYILYIYIYLYSLQYHLVRCSLQTKHPFRFFWIFQPAPRLIAGY